MFVLDFDFSTDKDKDIYESLTTLYSTRAGSMPMIRNYGIDYEITVDLPIDVAMNQLALEIIEKTEKYEPRVTVSKVDFDVVPGSGQLIPKIHIVKAGDTDE